MSNYSDETEFPSPNHVFYGSNVISNVALSGHSYLMRYVLLIILLSSLLAACHPGETPETIEVPKLEPKPTVVLTERTVEPGTPDTAVTEKAAAQGHYQSPHPHCMLWSPHMDVGMRGPYTMCPEGWPAPLAKSLAVACRNKGGVYSGSSRPLYPFGTSYGDGSCNHPSNAVFLRTGNVRAGDTLSSIAKRHNTDVHLLAAMNLIANPDIIRAGQDILIPPSLTADICPGAILWDEASQHVGTRKTVVGILVHTQVRQKPSGESVLHLILGQPNFAPFVVVMPAAGFVSLSDYPPEAMSWNQIICVTGSIRLAQHPGVLGIPSIEATTPPNPHSPSRTKAVVWHCWKAKGWERSFCATPYFGHG